MPSTTVRLGSIEIYLRDTGPHPEPGSAGPEGTAAGEGATVLLLHGWPDTGDLWRHQVPALAGAGYRVLAPDLRGFGASSKPTDLAAYSADVILGDVLGILDVLGVERAHIVGHDWGAAFAWMTAALAPERVNTLTALSVGHPNTRSRSGILEREKSWYMLLFQFPEIAETWLSADNFANLREWSRHPDIDHVVERLADPAALTAGLALYRAILPARTLVEPPPALPSVTVPTLGIWSSGDAYLTESRMTASKGYVTGPWQYERIENAGHWIPLDAPEILNRLLLDFIGRPWT
jgi:pimeloyl-ACP methyl ester carboxylesterase